MTERGRHITMLFADCLVNLTYNFSLRMSMSNDTNKDNMKVDGFSLISYEN